jgi:hypothetical protein
MTVIRYVFISIIISFTKWFSNKIFSSILAQPTMTGWDALKTGVPLRTNPQYSAMFDI